MPLPRFSSLRRDFRHFLSDIRICNCAEVGYTRIVCKRSRKVFRNMQDEDAPPLQSPSNRWMTLIVVFIAQAFGAAFVYPSLSFAPFINPKLLTGRLAADAFLNVKRCDLFDTIVRLPVYG